MSNTPQSVFPALFMPLSATSVNRIQLLAFSGQHSAVSEIAGGFCVTVARHASKVMGTTYFLAMFIAERCRA